MRVAIDIEANGLENPDKIWCIVCKDIDTGKYYVFRTEDEINIHFVQFETLCSTLIGHNILGYDVPVLCNLLSLDQERIASKCVDTLIVSKLVNYSREGHSIEAYGEEFGLLKGVWTDFSKYTPEMEEYCVRDVDICHRIYLLYQHIIDDPSWSDAINLEQAFQTVVNDLHTNGFCFNSSRATDLLNKVSSELAELDEKILSVFPPKAKLIREITPRYTKHGTLNRNDFRWVKDGDLSRFNGGPFCNFHYEPFNPASHKQVIDVLNDAGWKPVDKTKTHVETEREYNQLNRRSLGQSQFDIEKLECYNGLQKLGKYGWKINENNLSTLPESAPPAAKFLAKRILLESRRRTLTEWLSLVRENGRIHGKFYGLGAWTHRMAHQNPNTANIPNEYDTSGKKKLLGKEMRSLWCAPKNRLLVGVDAEGIQLRIFAHYIDDFEFTQALVNGRKEDKTDPHSLNQRILGTVCKSRAAAKRFIYALLLGAGLGKLSEILECSREECQQALNRLLERYAGFGLLKREVIPRDAEAGYFVGLDGRKVRIPGENVSGRAHLAMSGYLQNGEAIVMKMATLEFYPRLKEYKSLLVNFVHDEWQTETPNDLQTSLTVAKLKAESLRVVGDKLKLKCPLAGSYWNDDAKDYTIGTNWSVTH